MANLSSYLRRGFLEIRNSMLQFAISHYDRGTVRGDNNSITHIMLNLNEEGKTWI